MTNSFRHDIRIIKKIFWENYRWFNFQVSQLLNSIWVKINIRLLNYGSKKRKKEERKVGVTLESVGQRIGIEWNFLFHTFWCVYWNILYKEIKNSNHDKLITSFSLVGVYCLWPHKHATLFQSYYTILLIWASQSQCATWSASSCLWIHLSGTFG